jgi:hypothetical protein
MKDELTKAIRELIKSIYYDCKGAYGADSYEGEYETEIQNIVNIICKEKTEETKD